jgi:hypothetical protein
MQFLHTLKEKAKNSLFNAKPPTFHAFNSGDGVFAVPWGAVRVELYVITKIAFMGWAVDD